MTTKTKTKNSTTTADALAEAQTMANARAIELRQARDARAALDARLAAGDDAVTTTDLIEADATVKRAGTLLIVARKNLADAAAADERARAEASPDVARMLARLIEDHGPALGLYGVPITMGDPPADQAAPGVYIWQMKPTQWDVNTGMGQGMCLLHIIADVSYADRLQSLCAGLSDKARAESAASLDFGSGGSRTYGAGLVGWTKIVTGKTIRPMIPTLTGTTPPAFLSNGLATAVRDAVQERPGLYRETGVRIGAGMQGSRVAMVSCISDPPTHAGATTDSDGLIRRVYEIGFDTYSREMDGDGLVKNASMAIESLAGEFRSGLGRIESATLTKVGPAGRDGQGRQGTARIVLVSRKP
jgi:hypothetical protein